MSDLVNADPNDLRSLARELERFGQQTKDLCKQTQRSLDRCRWNDRQKQQFEQRFREAQRQLERFSSQEVAQMVKALNAHASDLERVRSRTF